MSRDGLWRLPSSASWLAHRPEPGSPSRLRHRALEVAWITLIFFVFGSGAAPEINEPHYLCRARHFWDPSFCQGDFFLQTRDAHGVFFWLFGWLTRGCSLPVSAWIGRLLAWLLLAGAWQRLSFTLVPMRWMSLLTAALWVTLIERCHMSGEWLIGGIEAKVLAYALVVWGLSFWVEAKWNRSWILAGAGAAIHVLVGGWSVIAMLLTAVGQGSRGLRELAMSWPGLLAGGLLSLAGLLPALQLNAHVSREVVHRATEIYTFDRISHHLLIRDFDSLAVLRHLLLIAVFVALWQPLRSEQPFRWLAGVVLSAVFMVIVGAALDAALGDSTWAARLLRYYWFRASDVMVPLGVSLAVAAHLRKSLATHPGPAAAGLTILVLLVSANGLAGACRLSQLRIPAADRQGGIRDEDQFVAWRDICRWVEEHLPRQAIVLTPADHQTFKWYAKRGELVTWKDVPQDAASILEWSQRLARVRHWQQSETSTESATRLAALERDYHFDFILVRWPASFPMPARRVVMLNNHYALLEAD
jgi:hypothetical protein